MLHVDGNDNEKILHTILKAIDFFSQRVHIEQIIEYSFQFFRELLPLHATALFVRDDQQFVLKRQVGYDIDEYTIPSSKKMDEIPLYHGNVLSKDITTYFPEEVVQRFQIHFVMPLMIETELVGFILSARYEKKEITDDDIKIISYLMKLINTSLENNQRMIHFQQVNQQLDQQIFNLLVIHQSTKTLLSELNLEQLYAIATDVFSEITGSAVTSFGIYDPFTNKIKMRGYRNVHSFHPYYTELELITRTYSGKVVLHVEKDDTIIKTLIKNREELQRLKAEYVILMVKEEIFGVVTISKSITNEPYQPFHFELIESLASTTYIAIKHATLFKEIQEQRELAEKKYQALNKFNRLMKTINSAKSKDELLSLTLKILYVGFGVKKAFFSKLQDDGSYYILKSLGIDEIEGLHFQFHPSLKEEGSTDEIFYKFESQIIANYFANDELIQKFGETNGVVLAPIHTNKQMGEVKQEPTYYLIIVDTKENLKNEEILIIDTIANNISPILSLMEKNEENV